jgi:hypothetical protein
MANGCLTGISSVDGTARPLACASPPIAALSLESEGLLQAANITFASAVATDVGSAAGK